MLEFVILVAFVGSREVMVATELSLAMLAFERQEIDEVAVLSRTLVSDGEEPSRQFRRRSHIVAVWYRSKSEPEDMSEVSLYMP